LGSVTEANKKVVTEFYDLLLNRKDFEGARRFMADDYKQHNPAVEDRPEGLKKFVEFLKANFPDQRNDIKNIIAEGDYVVLHVHALRPPETRGRVIIEIFRLAGGKIEEHWDVIQEIPEVSANPNGPF
jgi:predicted SnoaL-like aldol condensation-catalyzing enzyme